MPTTYHPPRVRPSDGDEPASHTDEHVPSTSVCHETENIIGSLHRTITGHSHTVDSCSGESTNTRNSFAKFEEYLRRDQDQRPKSIPVSVCFKNVTTYGSHGGAQPVKTVWDAIRRTLTLRDIYEVSLKKFISPEKIEHGRPLIRDFSGVVKNGEIMLVLGNPGSGCSTFLRTIGNDRGSFLGVQGSIDYSGLSPQEVSKNCRGLVSYVPEDDVHLPTLTVRQTLEFALCNKTPKRWLHEVPRFLDIFGQVFGMSHVMDTLVGNEFIRGVSGGERKRVSILESLASDASVNTWDGSTRGLDAASAVDYIRSLRIITDACQRATIVSIYQASDEIYNMVDKVMLIDEGRMLYQGPAAKAESYFSSLGYRRLPRQTMSDFLTSIPLANKESINECYEAQVPRGTINLENTYRTSEAFQQVKNEIAAYEAEQKSLTSPSPSIRDERKSRYVSSKSSYNTSFLRQVLLCARRELWQLRGHKLPFITKLACIIICAFLLGSMFYQMPLDTDGVYSRGGFGFYSAALVAWFQMAELETAFYDRDVVSRQKRYAAVRPAAVVAGKVLVDLVLVMGQCVIYAIIAYWLAGMKADAASFFGYTFATFFAAIAYTAFYRVFGAASPRIEIALRYCGLLLLVAMVCGGYVRSVEKLISEVPWIGWLAYTTPVLYAYEIIMALEFHGREFPCASNSIIPAGNSYTDNAFRACATKGIETGQLSLSGDSYIFTQFGFSFSNIGRNFGILILFTVALIVINMWLVEKLDWAEGSGGSLEFSMIKKAQEALIKVADEETGIERSAPPSPQTEDSGRSNNGKLLEAKSSFTWRNLNYTVPTRAGDKQLLNDVSGYCEPGSLTALVGASGAGKSTLMTVLTQQATGKVTGAMKIDDREVDASFGREIGYCQQMDIHIETSTVREAFDFSALLRQTAEISRDDKLAYVDNVIEILGMRDLQHAIIHSLSLEQKKRTTIGVELCAKPSLLLFLDEPTSGLDSLGAMNIVRLLRRLADAGQAIICTIHQASQEQFELFDRVLALARGGGVYYSGEIGVRGKCVLDYFRQHGIVGDEDKNVADLLIEVTARNGTNFDDEDWCQVWADSSEAAAVLSKIDSITARPQGITAASPPTNTERQQASPQQGYNYQSSTTQQIRLLTRRTMTQYWRTPDYIYSRLYCSFFHALLNGLAFLQLSNDNSVAGMQYRIFSLFLVLMIVPEFINACSFMFIDNRNIWLGRELPSRVYGWKAFTTAQIVSEIPFALAGGIIFYMILYFLVGFPLGLPAGYTFLMVMMFHLFCTSWGQWIAALSADAVMAASIMPFFVIMCEFFNGVLQPQALMPAVWAYTMYYIGPFTYWIRGILAVILPGLAVQCLDSELVKFTAPEGFTCGQYTSKWLGDGAVTGYLANEAASGECGYCQYRAGDELAFDAWVPELTNHVVQYLSSINLSSSEAWPFLGIFALFTVTNYICVYLFVYMKSVKSWLPW